MLVKTDALVLDTMYGGETPCRLHADKYQSGGIALSLVTLDGEPLARITVCFPEIDLMPFEVAVKDWSENTDMGEWMIENNLGKPTGKGITSGFVCAPIFELSPEIFQQCKELLHAAH